MKKAGKGPFPKTGQAAGSFSKPFQVRKEAYLRHSGHPFKCGRVIDDVFHQRFLFHERFLPKASPRTFPKKRVRLILLFYIYI